MMFYDTKLAGMSTDGWGVNVDSMAENGNIFNRNVTTRISNALLMPASIITNGIDAIKEVACAALNVLNPKRETLIGATPVGLAKLIPNSFFHGLKIINPHAKCEDSSTNPAICSVFIGNAITNIDETITSDNFFTKHVSSRLIGVLSTLALTIALLADTTLGLLAGALSFMTLGLVTSINKFAICHLSCLGTIPIVLTSGLTTLIHGK